MGFTTQIFLFVFFPLCFSIYFLVFFLQRKGLLSQFLSKIRANDWVLLIFSMGFFAWAGVTDSIRFFIYIIAVYLLAKIIEILRIKNRKIAIIDGNGDISTKGISYATIFFVVVISILILCLCHFKYNSIIIQAWNMLFKDSLVNRSILAPLGISFITFSAISYISDIYMGKAKAGSFLDCALYLSFFPKVISGPIVLWRDYSPQLKNRNVNIESISEGVSRIMIGFAKKVILADRFGATLSSIAGWEMDIITAVGSIILFALQLYYDFSGYSDIAIGLSRLVGFDVKDNFNFPYLSKSVSEFWRRWHISLGTWFKEYIYFPLGGSRTSRGRTLFNLAVIFSLTGMWNGAGWNYILWGMVNGLAVIAERLFREKKIYLKTPGFIKWLVTFLFTLCSWQIFRYSSMRDILRPFAVIMGLIKYQYIPFTWEYFFDVRTIIFMIIGFIGATLFGLPAIQRLYHKLVNTKLGYVLVHLIIFSLFIIAIMFMVNSSYSPFLYFQY